MIGSGPMRRLGFVVVFASAILGCSPGSEELQARLSRVEAPSIEALDGASQQQLGEARRSLKASLAGPEPDLDGFFQLGRLYLAYDYPRAAAQAMDQALELGVNRADVHYLRAVAAVDVGDLERAASHFRASLEHEPGDVPSMVRLAELMSLGGDTDAARRLYEQLLRLHPRHAFGLAQQGRLALEQGDPESAVVNLSAALSLQPDATALYHTLAAALGALGREEERRIALSKAGQRQPSIDDPRMQALQGLVVGVGAHLDLARKARGQGDIEVAVSHLQAALQYEPGNVTALHNLGVLRGMQGRNGEAIALLNRALEEDPNNADLLFDLATAQAASGGLEEAAASLERVVELRPGDQEARSRLRLVKQAMQRGAGS